MKKIRLYGNIKDLRKTGCNSTCDYYSLHLFVKINGSYELISAAGGFYDYSKKEIYRILKNQIIEKLNQYGIAAY